jgi:hypothetical protein
MFLIFNFEEKSISQMTVKSSINFVSYLEQKHQTKYLKKPTRLADRLNHKVFISENIIYQKKNS